MRLEPGQLRETVALEDAHVVVAGLDHNEQVERVGAVLRAVGQLGDIHQHPVTGTNVGITPGRRHGGRPIEVADQAVDLRCVEQRRVGSHLARRTAVPDDLARLVRLDPAKAFRQQGRAGAAEAIDAMAALAMLLVERMGIDCLGGSGVRNGHVERDESSGRQGGGHQQGRNQPHRASFCSATSPRRRAGYWTCRPSNSPTTLPITVNVGGVSCCSSAMLGSCLRLQRTTCWS